MCADVVKACLLKETGGWAVSAEEVILEGCHFAVRHELRRHADGTKLQVMSHLRN